MSLPPGLPANAVPVGSQEVNSVFGQQTQNKLPPGVPANAVPVGSQEANSVFGNMQDVPETQSKSWEVNAAKSLMAGGGEFVQNLMKTYQKVPSVLKMGSLPHFMMNAMNYEDPEMANQIASHMNSFMNEDLPVQMSIPPTMADKIFMGAGGAIPSIGLAALTDGATIPEIASSMTAQGALGAASDPNHPLIGAALNAGSEGIGQYAGHLLSGNKTIQALSKKISDLNIGKTVSDSMGRVRNFAQGVLDNANSKYDVLTRLGDTPLVGGERPISPTSMYGGPFSPNQAADYLKQFSPEINAKYPEMAQEDAIGKSVDNKFNQNTLKSFKRVSPKGGISRTAYENFRENPTALNAKILKDSLNKEMRGNPSKVDILQPMRDQLRDNVIKPGLTKIVGSGAADSYMDADPSYHTYKKSFEPNKMAKEFVQAQKVSPELWQPKEYEKILGSMRKSAESKGAPQPIQDFLKNEHQTVSSARQAFENTQKALNKTKPTQIGKNALAKFLQFGNNVGVRPAINTYTLNYNNQG